MLPQHRGQHEAARAEAGQHEEAVRRRIDGARQGQSVGRDGANAGAPLEREAPQSVGQTGQRLGERRQLRAWSSARRSDWASPRSWVAPNSAP